MHSMASGRGPFSFDLLQVVRFPDNPKLLSLKNWGPLEDASIAYDPIMDAILPAPDDQIGILRFVGLQNRFIQDILEQFNRKFLTTEKPATKIESVAHGYKFPLAEEVLEIWKERVEEDFPDKERLDKGDETWGNSNIRQIPLKLDNEYYATIEY